MDRAHEILNVTVSGTRMSLTVDGKQYEIEALRAHLSSATGPGPHTMIRLIKKGRK